METNDEFYDAFETLEELSMNITPNFENTHRVLNTSPTQENSKELGDLSEYKTDVSLPGRKSTLFSWTTVNLSSQKNKDVKEFSGLEIIQEIVLDDDFKRNWVLKFSPNGKYLALAGESPIIFIFPVSQYNSEKSLNLLEFPQKYAGHSQSVINITWEKSSESFLSFSVDNLVLLWKIGQNIPIKQFLYSNIVTCAGFYPSNSNVFYTGSLDKKICLWTIEEGIIENTYQAQGLITAGSYSPNGNILAIGLSNGECIIYEAHNIVLTFITQIHCKNRKGLKSNGKKVTGIEFHDDQYLLLSTNDSRIRLYSLTDFILLQKYSGGICEQYPIRSTFSHNFVHVIRGSEDGKVYVWNTFKAESKRKWIFRDNTIKNKSFEYFSLSKKKSVSDSIFAPSEVLNRVQKDYMSSGSEVIISHIILCSVSGKLSVLYNQFKNVPW
jgi:WD40 repeat protein